MNTKVLSVFAGSLMLAGVANAAYVELNSEVYTNAAYEAPAGTVTYRLYATFDNEMDQLTGLGGADVEPWWLHTNTEFFNDLVFGEFWAHNGNLDAAFQFLHYDSYWTIGTDTTFGHAALGIAFPGVQPTWDDTDWYADDGGVYRTPEDPLTFAGAELRVLVGQFTINASTDDPGFLEGAIKMNITSGGETVIVYEEGVLIPIPAPGALALLGLAGLVGRRRR